MFDMGELMKKAQELSTNMQEQQEQLAKETIEVSVGGEMVKMTFNGKLEAQIEQQSKEQEPIDFKDKAKVKLKLEANENISNYSSNNHSQVN